MSKWDYEAKADFIIRKVFDRGSLEDVAEVLAYYGKERVQQALANAPYLMEKTRCFASTIFHLPLFAFRCSTTKQYHPLS